ncbi:hypothetical protein M434DRAFT_27135 [Hypoxylon sp. CO27-5]|nr:hypothetical protein M434DRAFT_27135 [Hypoxylon sp. CO27-5]
MSSSNDASKDPSKDSSKKEEDKKEEDKKKEEKQDPIFGDHGEIRQCKECNCWTDNRPHNFSMALKIGVFSSY